jgi:S-adenosylmethionine hydrolase
MAKSQNTFNKQDNEKKRLKKRQDKLQKKEERKANGGDSDFDSMIAYVDEYGNITSTPPDPTKKKKIDASTIEIGVSRREEVAEPDGEHRL